MNDPRSSLPAGVLRGVSLAGPVRLLERPRSPVPASTAMAVLASHGVPQPTATSAPVGPLPPTPHVAATAKVDPTEAAETRRRAEAEGWQAGREEGQAQGFAEGLARGRVEGERECQRMTQESLQGLQAERGRLQALAASLASAIDARHAALEEEMLAWCFEAVSRVLGEALLQPQGRRQLILQALAQCRVQAGAVTVRVHPDDLVLVRRDASLTEALGPQAQVSWQADARIGLGGCVIAAPDGGWDARLETQLARLAEVLAAGAGPEVSP